MILCIFVYHRIIVIILFYFHYFRVFSLMIKHLLQLYGGNTHDACMPIIHWTKTKISAYQNMSFPTHLEEDRAEFLYMCRKLCTILHISYMHEIHIDNNIIQLGHL